MKKTLRGSLVGALGLALLFPASATASASPAVLQDQPNVAAEATGLDADDERAERDFLTRYDVPVEFHDSIIASLANGEPLDADGGVEPTSVEHFTEGGKNVAITRFPDGSLIVESVSIPQEPNASGIGTRSIEGCIYNAAGSNAYQASYVDCVISVEKSGVTMKFTFDYLKFNGASKITAVRNRVIRLSNSVLQSSSLQITRADTSGTTVPATARLTAISVAGSTTYTHVIEVKILGSSAPRSYYSF